MKTSSHIQGKDYKLGDLRIWFQFYASAENLSLFQSLPTGSGTSSPPPPIQWAPQVFFPGTKGPKYAEIKIMWSYTLISPYICIAWGLIQYKDNFACICCGLAALCVTLLYQGIGKLKEVQELLVL